jgi:hypothetical protein
VDSLPLCRGEQYLELRDSFGAWAKTHIDGFDQRGNSLAGCEQSILQAEGSPSAAKPIAEKLELRIRVSLRRYRKSREVGASSGAGHQNSTVFRALYSRIQNKHLPQR